MAMSQWTKDRNNERLANNPFREGMKVARVTYYGHGRRISGSSRVAKVHKNGNVVLFHADGSISDKAWKPDQDGTRAAPVGKDRYAREHIEPWTVETEKELFHNKIQRDANQRRLQAATQIQADCSLTLRQIVAIEAALMMEEGE